jgi:hypothetical protein
MRYMVADGASHGRTGQAMMPGNMSGNTADDSALDAPRLAGNRRGK